MLFIAVGKGDGVYEVIIKKSNNSTDVLGEIADIADSEPKFFKKDFTILFQYMKSMVFDKKITESNLKQQATEILITIGERIPSLLKNQNSENLRSLLEIIFFHMVFYNLFAFPYLLLIHISNFRY